MTADTITTTTTGQPAIAATPDQNPPLLDIRGLTVEFATRNGPVQAVTAIDISIARGETIGIVGESGSGKSTLLNCLAGHLTPDCGAVRFDTRADGLRDTVTMSEPERRMLGRTDWAFVHQHARDGLRMSVSAGGNIGDRDAAFNHLFFGAGDRKKSSFGLHQQVVSLLVFIGPFITVAGDVTDDEPVESITEMFIA